MNLVAGQRCLVVWMDLLLTLIALVIYLDGSNDRQPIFLGIVLFLTDAICFASIFYDILFVATTQGIKFEKFRDFWNYVWPTKQFYVAQFVCITMKVFFELLLFIQIATPIYIPAFIIFVPFWIIFGIAFYDLTRRLYCIQKRA